MWGIVAAFFAKVVPRLLVPGKSWKSKARRTVSMDSGVVSAMQAVSGIQNQAPGRWARVTRLVALVICTWCA